ncbi:MAG TPA: hypothetical protein VJ205_00625, partial [Gammaproteobacteria bacterium]|nr:hypothetical protein [Gammaproteobacteria bacterium]
MKKIKRTPTLTRKAINRTPTVISKLISKKINPLAVYATLCDFGKKHHSALFCVDDKENAGSKRTLVMSQAALKLSLKDSKITLEALSPLGQSLISVFSEKECESCILIQKANQSKNRNTLDSERIRQPNVLDSIRKVLALLPQNEGGFLEAQSGIVVFSFDLIESFEKMEPLEKDPFEFGDFVFYLPEELMVYDHDNQEMQISLLHLECDSESAQKRLNQLI